MRLKTKLVFICSPYRSDHPDPMEKAKEIQYNIQMARDGCRIAVERNHIPIAPHLFFPQFLSEETERDIGREMGAYLLGLCDELWVLGRKITDGMATEILCARELGLTVRIMEDPKTGTDRLMKDIGRENKDDK